jgi:hypothetical protein
MTSRAASRLLGLAMALPPLAWYGYQQGLGAVLRIDCARAGGWTGPLWGLFAFAACVGAGLAGRLAWGPIEGPARRQTLHLLGFLALSSAVLFALAILYQMAATWIIPSCAR